MGPAGIRQCHGMLGAKRQKQSWFWYYRIFATRRDRFGSRVTLQPPQLINNDGLDVLCYNSVDAEFDSTFKVNLVGTSDGTITWIPPGATLPGCTKESFRHIHSVLQARHILLAVGRAAMLLQGWRERPWICRMTDMFSSARGPSPDDKSTCSRATSTYPSTWRTASGSSSVGFAGTSMTNNSQHRSLGEPFREVLRMLSRRSLSGHQVLPSNTPKNPVSCKTRAAYTICTLEFSYYIFNLIMPCILTMVLVVLSFTLSPEACEKVSLQISVSLAIIIFMTIVSEMTPRTSEAVPLLGGLPIEGSSLDLWC